MERISIFEIFKIGIGPSSSHTLGPWRAALAFVSELDKLPTGWQDNDSANYLVHIQVDLYGSLAKTGRGHGTDLAISLGLGGSDPEKISSQQVTAEFERVTVEHKIFLAGSHPGVIFDPAEDIIFHRSQSLAFHPNGMRFTATFADESELEAEYYSIGGGFIVKGGQEGVDQLSVELPYPIDVGADLAKWCLEQNRHVAEIVATNEAVWRSPEKMKADLLHIWQVMLVSIYEGCHSSGVLPGGLNVERRAAAMNSKLLAQQPANGEFSTKKIKIPEGEQSISEAMQEILIRASDWTDCIRGCGGSFQSVMRWVSCFALAVNEQNASFGRVVTAPTNGSAGVVPAVLMYFICFCSEFRGQDDIVRFLLVAGEFGSLFKKGATISAAMGGCQAEIGVSSAMAAAALTECSGGTPAQTMMAAEIALEHHLGLTCDPVGGLVQIPCIERNSMGAIKAITASQLALASDPQKAKISLDAVIQTMLETANDMNMKYKETSDGGLATKVALGLVEC